MPLSRAEQLIRRYQNLKGRQGVWRSTWQELADYIRPVRKNVTATRTGGSKQTEKLFDSTAPDSATKLAAFIAGSLTNMAIKWFSLKMRSEELNSDPEIAEWLDSCAKEIYLALRQSNFNTESQELYADLATFGTGGMLIEEKDAKDGQAFGGFMFRTEAIGSYVISENADGLAETVMREFTLPLGAAASKWGKENLSDASQEKLKKDPDELLTIVHCVVPRDTAPGVLKKNKPFGSYYLELERKKLLDEGGYDEQPFIVVRWSKTSGEEYGRGPGHIALPDIKTLNKADELTLRGWAKIIAPPLLARQDGVSGRVRTSPEAITIVDDVDKALKPMEQGGKWDVNAALTTDRRAAIKRYFYSDQLQLPDKTIITATEVERRIELMQQILGPTVGRLEYEYLNPLISRCFKMMLRAKVLPPVPEKLRKSGAVIDVEYEGPLARAQRAGDVQAFTKLITAVAPVIQLNPNSQILAGLNEQAAFRMIAEVTGNSPKLLLSDEEVANKQAQQQAAVEAQQNQDAAVNASQATKNMAEADATMRQNQPSPSPYGETQEAA